MEIQLKNIGMIKEASIKIDGLTVIAGENDTGKSTVGKALFAMINEVTKVHKLAFFDRIFHENYFSNQSHVFIKIDDTFQASLTWNDEDEILESEGKIPKEFTNVIFIETPFVMNFVNSFSQINKIQSRLSLYGDNIIIDLPFLTSDLLFKLSIRNNNDGIKIINEIKKVIGGFFEIDDIGNIDFIKNNKKIDILNTAMGIKTFGILQILSKNNYLIKDSILILDEPEVHLHPKWQLKMAELIVLLVQSGVKILVNSHSPYMIEALQRYSEREKVTADFYLAEDGYINKINDSNSQTLEKIFEKLSEPFDVFDEMDSQSMKSLLNG